VKALGLADCHWNAEHKRISSLGIPVKTRCIFEAKKQIKKEYYRMTDLKLNIGKIQGAVALDKLAERIYRSYQAEKIRGYSSDFHRFRIECSKQLQSLSKSQVKAISKILLLKYDLRLLGYELIYYHDS